MFWKVLLEHSEEIDFATFSNHFKALTNITMNREPALDQARQYYELLYQRPDELVNTVEESGPKYHLDAYLVALSLSYK